MSPQLCALPLQPGLPGAGADYQLLLHEGPAPNVRLGLGVLGKTQGQERKWDGRAFSRAGEEVSPGDQEGGSESAGPGGSLAPAPGKDEEGYLWALGMLALPGEQRDPQTTTTGRGDKPRCGEPRLELGPGRARPPPESPACTPVPSTHSQSAVPLCVTPTQAQGPERTGLPSPNPAPTGAPGLQMSPIGVFTATNHSSSMRPAQISPWSSARGSSRSMKL